MTTCHLSSISHRFRERIANLKSTPPLFEPPNQDDPFELQRQTYQAKC